MRIGSAAAIVVAALSASGVHAQSAQRARATLTTATRTFTIGDTSVSEGVATAKIEVFAPRMRFRLEGTTLRYSAPGTTISGHLPIAGQFDFASRPGDTLTIFARTSSEPFALTASQTTALGTAGTSTIDLQSTALGTVAAGGARAAFAFPVGDAVLSIRGGLDLEPRPNGSAPVYWRGTTVRAGVGVTSSVGDGSLTASIDAAHSAADSLGGRNLFPGGGSVTLQLLGESAVTNPFDPLEDERWPLRAVAFYSRPMGDDRADQPNLLIPQGDLLGFLGIMFVPLHGDVSVSPSLQLLRETSFATATSGLVRSASTGSAWTAQGALDVTIPIGSMFELTPQAGYTVGSVGASFAQGTVLRRGRGVTRSSSFSDSIRGSWLALQLSATF